MMEWKEALSINIPTIDKQHKLLIGLINKLEEAEGEVGKADYAKQLVGLALDGLMSYTNMHFGYEALLFKRHGYSESKEHLELHDNFCKMVDRYKMQYERGDVSFVSDLLAILNKWLTHHIMIEDMAYSEYLIERGVK